MSQDTLQQLLPILASLGIAGLVMPFMLRKLRGGTVPLRQIIAWGVSAIGDNMMAYTIVFLGLQIYQVGLGISPLLISITMMAPRLFDAFIDPFIGSLSDNARTRWGRRRPFIVAGSVLMSVFYVLTWTPPTGLGPGLIYAYFTVMVVISFFGYALFTIPCGALGIELSRDPEERTRIITFRYFFFALTNVFMPSLYLWSQSPVLGRNEVEGVRWVGLIGGIVILVTTLLPAVFCRERVEVQAQAHTAFLPAVTMTLRSKPFLIVAASVFLVLVGGFMIGNLGFYIGLYHVAQGDKHLQGVLGSYGGVLMGGLGRLSVPVITSAATRYGKKRVFMGGLAIAIVGYLSCWFLYTPAHPYWSLIPMALAHPGQSCVWALAGAFVADICDMDELESGLRREGMFSAVYAFCTKAGIACVTGLSGVLLTFAGISGNDIPGPGVILNLRIMYVTTPAFFLSLAILLMWCYPITDRRAKEIRAELDARKTAWFEAAVTEPAVNGAGAGLDPAAPRTVQ